MENKPILHVMASKDVQRNWKSMQHMADSIKRVFGSKYQVIFTPNEGKGEEPTCTIIPDNSTIVNLSIDTEKDMNRFINILDRIPDKCNNIEESATCTIATEISDQQFDTFEKQFSKDGNTCIQARVGTSGPDEDDSAVTIIDIANINNFKMRTDSFGSNGIDGVKIVAFGNNELELIISSLQFVVDTLKAQWYQSKPGDEIMKEEDYDLPYNPNPIHGC